MYFYVYMLISKGVKPISYVGYTNNLKNRINLHNSGKGAKFTKGRKWKLIYKEKFKSKSKAISIDKTTIETIINLIQLIPFLIILFKRFVLLFFVKHVITDS